MPTPRITPDSRLTLDGSPDRGWVIRVNGDPLFRFDESGEAHHLLAWLEDEALPSVENAEQDAFDAATAAEAAHQRAVSTFTTSGAW